MDIQNEILDYLGDQATVETLREDFDGKSQQEILDTLNEWFPSDDNAALAQKISDYIGVHSAAAALGRMGGKSTSPAKRKASAANGKLGGRPKKQTD